jgi:cytochrome c-type biogenesis protein CcmH/NrfG
VLLCNLAGAYAALHQFLDLITACEQAIQVAPNNPKPWAMLGHGYVCTADYVRAAEAFREWTKLEPQNPEAWRWLGAAYTFSGDFPDLLRARQALTRSEALRQEQHAKASAPQQASPTPATRHRIR